MRAWTIVVVLAVVAVGCGSRGSRDQASADSKEGASAAAEAGSFVAEVADVDAKGRTITLRSPSVSAAGAGSTLRRIPVDGAAASQLASLEAGDQVVVACDDAARGPATSAGAGGGDSGVGASATEDLATCRKVAAVRAVGRPDVAPRR